MGPVKAQHGFARNTEFTVVNATADSVTLSLSPYEEQRQGHFPDHTLYVKVHSICSAQALLLISCKPASAILVPSGLCSHHTTYRSRTKTSAVPTC
jgi:hypothetical protein